MISARAVPLLTAILLFSLPFAAQAEPVGRVIMTVGPVTATDRDDRERSISRHDPVYEGESVRTGSPRGRAQIRLRDEGLIQLRPGTEFDIEQYREPEDDQGGSAVMNLVEGALRKISGRIGTRDEDEYEMNTPTATVGIRGTDYSLQYCGEDCIGDDRQLGVYGRVDNGTVIVENEFGVQEFGTGDHFFVPDEGSPSLLLTPPDGILDDAEDAAAAEEDEESDIEVAVTPVVNGEPLDGEGEAQFEAGAQVADELLTDDLGEGDSIDEGDSIAVAFGGGGFPEATEIPVTEGGFILSDDVEVQFDAEAEGQPLRFISADGTTLDGSDAVIDPAGRAMDVDWAAWGAGEGASFVIDGSEIANGFAFVAVTDNLTDPTAMNNLSGERQLSLDVGGPETAFASDGSFLDAYNIDQFDVLVDFDGDPAAVLESFGASRDAIEISLAGELNLDMATATISGSEIEGSWEEVLGGGDITLEGDVIGDFDGVILAEDASGALFAFSLERFTEPFEGVEIIEDIVGTAILSETE